MISEVGSTNIIPLNKKPRLDAECRQLREMKKESRKEWKIVCDSIVEQQVKRQEISYLKLVRLQNKAK